jgi:hypothetical protein
MDSRLLALLAADTLLVIHVLFVCFVIGGLLLILLGKPLRWAWVRNPWFRLVHLAAIGVVVAQSWLGMICPLTTWEMFFRERAGDAVYAGTFVSHWLEAILYYQAPPWVFAVSYTAFAAAVIASWIWVRPRSLGKQGKNDTA